jgi:hypothetical protein
MDSRAPLPRMPAVAHARPESRVQAATDWTGEMDQAGSVENPHASDGGRSAGKSET